MSLNISIKNFQSIKEANLNLSSFTVITGSSNLGKSAVRRAFATVLYNDWDASYIRDGYESAEIELERNENLIKVKKEYKKKISKENSFCVNGKIYEKMGDGLPDEYKELGWLALKAQGKKYKLNIATQLEPLFMIGNSDVENKKDSIKTRLPDAKWTRKYEVLETNGLLDSFKDKTYAVCFNKKTMDAMTTYADESAYSIVEELNNLIKEKNSQVFACYTKANGNEYTKIGTISLYFPGINKIYHCKADNTKNKEVLECYRVAEADNFPAGYTQKVVYIPAKFSFFENIDEAICAANDWAESAIELKAALKTIMPNQSEPEKEIKDKQKGNCLIELSLKDGNISLRSDDEQSVEAIEIFNNYFSNLWESLGKLDNNILSREYYSMLKK